MTDALPPDDDGLPLGDRPTRIETAEPGVFRDMDALARDAAIQALAASDAPLLRADDLVAAVTGPALKVTVAMRVEQIVKHGHTLEGDTMHPIVWLPNVALQLAQAAHDAVRVPGKDRDLSVVRRRLARCAATCWAAIDRIDVAIAERHDG